jgi:hypothetical protein
MSNTPVASKPKVSPLQIEEVYSALTKLNEEDRRMILDRLITSELPNSVVIPVAEFDSLVKRLRDAYDFIPKLIQRAISVGKIPLALLAERRQRLDELTEFKVRHTRQRDADRETVFREILRAIEAGTVNEDKAFDLFKKEYLVLARYGKKRGTEEAAKKSFLDTFRKWRKSRESEEA